MKRNSLGRDRVRLDVGGRIFVTSVQTLTSSSSYFKARFSQEWQQGHDEDDEECSNQHGPLECFLDQDPEPFEVLLSFMRNGFVHSEKICQKVLAQADFLGIDSLISAVKCKTYLLLNPHKYVQVRPTFENVEVDEVEDSEHDYYKDIINEILVAFDNDHGGIGGAIGNGTLPESLFIDDINEQNDYASITLIRKTGHIPLISFQTNGVIQGTHYCQSNPPRHNKFILALNWIYRNKYSNQIDTYNNATENFEWRRLTFSRKSDEYKNSVKRYLLESMSQTLLERNDKLKVEKIREITAVKQFAMIAYCQHHNNDGNLPPYAIVIIDPRSIINDTSARDVNNQDDFLELSEQAWMHTCAGIDEAMNLLTNKSFTHREEAIEDFYRPMLVSVSGAMEVSIFSCLSSLAKSQTLNDENNGNVWL